MVWQAYPTPRLPLSVCEVNSKQERQLVHEIAAFFNSHLVGRTVAVWGLTFKSKIKDMRAAPPHTGSRLLARPER